MTISIIVPTYNGERRIQNTLNALVFQSKVDFELVIIIDGSEDHTIDVLDGFQKKFKTIKIIEQENKGRAGARNTGIKKSTGDLIVFLDDDIRLNVDGLQRHLEHHKKHTNSILVGNQLEDPKLISMDFQLYKSHLSEKWLKGIAESKQKINVPYISAANFSVGRNTIQKLEGFNEILTDAEDYDLAIRAFKNKSDIFYDPELIGWHDDFVTCRKYILRQRQYENAKIKVLKIHDLVSSKIEIRFYKRILFRIFAFNIWVRLIDANKLLWMPIKIRYKIYDLVVTSLGVYNTQVRIK